MAWLRRLLGRANGRGAAADTVAAADEVGTDGWNAIDEVLKRRYGDQEPAHFGTLIPWRLGGPDPLDGISAYRNEGRPPHWHFVTYGPSELYEKESENTGEAWAYTIDGAVLIVTLPPSQASALGGLLEARAAEYSLPSLPGLMIRVVPSVITDAVGREVERMG